MSVTPIVVVENAKKTMKKICSEYSIPNIQIEFTGRLRAANGMFSVVYDNNKLKFGNSVDSIVSKKIKISSQLYALYGYDEVDKTLKHELAHYINFIKNKSFSHDKNFKELCVKLGGNMNEILARGDYKEAVCKNWVSDKVGWLYKCPCGFEHSTIRKVSDKMMNRYRCPHCRTLISKFSLTKKG